MDEVLRERRRRLDAVRVGQRAAEGVLAPEVMASWQRCRPHVGMHLDRVPTVDDDVVETAWTESRIRRAGAAVLDELAAVADAGDHLAAITDAEGTILWCHGGREMRRRGEAVNFVRGGRWSEQHAGTNALALALTSARPATVFSSEHWCDAVTDWVCYSAPVLDPVTGAPLGVIDLSATWERSSALGLTTVSALARLVEAQLTKDEPARSEPSWRLRLSGRAELTHAGSPVPLTARQTEILAVIALCDGLSLDELHAHVYGDRPVAMSTLKAEVSHLRKRTGGLVASRPYRIDGAVQVDLVEMVDALEHRDLGTALDRYRGPVLPRSESPLIEARSRHLEATLLTAVLTHGTPTERFRYGQFHPDDLDLLDATPVA